MFVIYSIYNDEKIDSNIKKYVSNIEMLNEIYENVQTSIVCINHAIIKELEKEIEKIRQNGYRWYTKIEKEDGYDRFSEYEMDYPSRLHYRTGAKLYKVKSGKFHIYWALGDNCASFTDLVLGTLGADVLSIRGIISPGTYLDWLQKEYLKKNSPIVFRRIYKEWDSK